MQPSKDTKKLTDEAFTRLMVVAILGILLCIICLCSTTYAWLSAAVPSSGNEVKAAECRLTVTVSREGVPLEGITEGVLLEPGVVYDVVLSLPPDNASGYCLITAGETVYYTEYIARHYEAEPQSVAFTMTVETEQTVIFTPRWGIYAEAGDVIGGVLVLP